MTTIEAESKIAKRPPVASSIRDSSIGGRRTTERSASGRGLVLRTRKHSPPLPIVGATINPCTRTPAIAMIAVHQLTKRFPVRRRAVLAVDRLSFVVQPGEVYGLLGPNGAGKTTTLRMIIGLLRPDDGFAEVGGYRTSEAPNEVKASIGLVLASDGVYPWLSAEEILLFFADLYGLAPRQARRRVRELSQLLGLSKFLDRRCIHLSTGQRQRVTLARALIHDPPVMLLDEPTRGLDVVGSQLVCEYIAALRSQGKAVILSTHRLDEAQRLCDRFGLLHEGRMQHEGALDKLRAATGRETLVDMFKDFIALP